MKMESAGGLKNMKIRSNSNLKWEDGCAVKSGKIVYYSIDCPECHEIVKFKTEPEREQHKSMFLYCPFCGEFLGGDDGT